MKPYRRAWGDLDGTRPVVHVTQGTIDNREFDRLVLPTVRALAELDVLVVVSLGGAAGADLGPLPGNVRVATYLPYDRLLPLTSVFVTNGGYGGIQHALSAGVPIVVAGDTEDKPEVAARVAWSGAGVNLRTGTPSADQLRAAVTRVLGTPAFRRSAQRLAASAAAHDARAAIDAELADAVTHAALQ